MLRKLCTVLTVLLAVTSASFADSGPNLKEGKWEITSKMEMTGMPMQMPEQKHTQCLTKKDLVPKSSQPGQECVVTDTKTTGNTVAWTMECKGQQGQMKGTGKMTYSGDTFKGEMVMTLAGQNMKIVNRMTGRRIGDCP
jgi:hypothetical protein